MAGCLCKDGSVSWKEMSIPNNLKVHCTMVVVEVLYAGFQVISRAAASSSLSLFVLPVYRNAVATLLIAPVAYFVEKKNRPSLTFSKLSQIFISALIGICINQILFLEGIYQTSATVSSSLQNLIPALTLLLATSLRVEEVHITTRDGQAKALGTIISLCGAMVITCYKGPFLLHFRYPAEGRSTSPYEIHRRLNSAYSSWQLGASCLLGNCATWATWFLLQTPILKNYPAQLSAASFTFAFGTVQSLLVALVVQRDFSTWAIRSETDLMAVLYGGIVASGVAMTMQSWCAHKGGPVLVSAYQPLQAVIVALLSYAILGETFYLGSVLGGFVIMVGLFLVCWGKAKTIELSGKANLSRSLPAGLSEPLLGERRAVHTVDSTELA